MQYATKIAPCQDLLKQQLGALETENSSHFDVLFSLDKDGWNKSISARWCPKGTGIVEGAD